MNWEIFVLRDNTKIIEELDRKELTTSTTKNGKRIKMRSIWLECTGNIYGRKGNWEEFLGTEISPLMKGTINRSFEY